MYNVIQLQVRGLYKGVIPPLVMQGTINAIVFAVRGQMSTYLETKVSSTTSLREGKIGFLSGMTAGFAQSIVCAPMELVKLRTQNNAVGTNLQAKRNRDTLREIYRTGKFSSKGLYQGLSVTALRDTTGFGIYFGVYESLMSLSAKKRGIRREELGNIYPFMYGGFAGMCSWLLNFPVDTVKSRYQMDGDEGKKRLYSSARDCFSKAIKQGGIRGLYTGLVMALVRAFVNSSFLFPAYEYSKKVLYS